MTRPIKTKVSAQPKDAAQDFDHFAPCTFPTALESCHFYKSGRICPVEPTQLTTFSPGTVATSATMIKTRDMNLATEKAIPGEFLLRRFLLVSEKE